MKKTTLARYLCKHRFPIQPPNGSFTAPGDCTHCGITYLERWRQIEAAAAAYRAGTAHRGYCPGCRRPDPMLFIFIREYRPWDLPDDPQDTVFLCARCWSDHALAEEKAIEKGEFFSIHELQARAEQHAKASQQPDTAAEPATTSPRQPTPDAGAGEPDNAWSQPQLTAA